MKAIVLWQPWATLMAVGAKTVETRSWPTAHRGPLLIVAAKRTPAEALAAAAGTPEIAAALAAHGYTLDAARAARDPLRHEMPYGMAVAVVEVVDCVRTESPEGYRAAKGERAFGDYRGGRWAWLTAPATRRIIAPFAVRGRQGLFEVEAETHVAVVTAP